MSFLGVCNVPSIKLPTLMKSVAAAAASPPPELEIRVCVNKICRKQGSMQTLEIISAISPPHISVNSCGCLGRCGAGPNLVVLPDAVMISHCATPAKAARFIVSLSGNNNDDAGGGDGDGGASRALEALALRKRADVELRNGNSSQALLLLSHAIDVQPCGGTHIALKDRASVKLALADYSGALQDTQQALALAPRYSPAYICQGDAFLAMDQVDAAEKSYSRSLELDPSLRRSKSFKARILKLEEKLSAANMH